MKCLTEHLDWTEVYKKKSELFLEEFSKREKEGGLVATYIDQYLRTEFPSVGKILDFPSGNGRISRNLKNLGYSILGLDMSEDFIADAIKRSSNYEPKAISSDFQVGDIKTEECLRKIKAYSPHLIINWWTSFGYLTKEDDFNFFSSLGKAVLPGTILMIETWHRFPILLSPIRKWWGETENFIVLHENEIDYTKPYVVTTHSYYKKSGNKLIFVDKFDSRIILYDIAELLEMLSNSGWRLHKIYNDIKDLIKFDYFKDRVVLILKKSS